MLPYKDILTCKFPEDGSVDEHSIWSWLRKVDALEAERASRQQSGTDTQETTGAGASAVLFKTIKESVLGLLDKVFASPALDPVILKEQAIDDKSDAEHNLKQYDNLLESYREHLDVLEALYSWKADVDANQDVEPALTEQWENVYNTLIPSIERRLAFMDLLEIAEAENLAAEGRIARRAELSVRQAEIEST
jgi:hypothetical protein